MNFTVTYRRKDGSLAKEVVAASSRADVISQMKARGVVPQQVTEGGALASAAGAAKPAWLKGAIAGAAVVVLAVVAFFLLSPKPEAPKPAPKPSPAAKPAPKPIVRRERPKMEQPVATQEVAKVEAPKKVLDTKRLKWIASLPPEQREIEMTKYHADQEIQLQPNTNQVFSTAAEQIMGWIFSCNVGDPPPLLPNIPPREMAHLPEILENVVLPKEDDSDKVKDVKEAVEQAKKELKAYLEKGGETKEFLQYYHSQLVQAHRTWQTAQQQVYKVAREDPDLVKAYIAEVNDEMDKKGIKHVRLPEPLAKNLNP